MRWALILGVAVCALPRAASADEPIPPDRRTSHSLVTAQLGLWVPLSDDRGPLEPSVGPGIMGRYEYSPNSPLALTLSLGFFYHLPVEGLSGDIFFRIQTAHLPILLGAMYYVGHGANRAYVGLDVGVLSTTTDYDGWSDTGFSECAQLSAGLVSGHLDVRMSFFTSGVADGYSVGNSVIATVGYRFGADL